MHQSPRPDSVRTKDPETPPHSSDLTPTAFLDCDHPRVAEFARSAIGDATDDFEKAGLLFSAVRDRIRYDPYSLDVDPSAYRASTVLHRGAAYCVPKAVLLTAAARAAGIPARLGFADVRNHLQSERLAAVMNTDVFMYHGYSTMWLGERWVKASPAFNAELCVRFGVPPLEFDGREDALLHAYTGDGRRHMEYLRDHGTRQDLPLDEILTAYAEHYPGMVDALGIAQRADDSFR